MKRMRLPPTLLEFFRAHLILTALGAALTVLTLALGGLLGVSGTLPALSPLALCLLAYLPAGRVVRRRHHWERPGVEEALLLLLVPAAGFWFLLGLSCLLPQGVGLVIAAGILNCPAYGLFLLWSMLTGWVTAAPPWAGYVSGLVSGLLPPLLYLAGSFLPIREIDRVEEGGPVKK